MHVWVFYKQLQIYYIYLLKEWNDFVITVDSIKTNDIVWYSRYVSRRVRYIYFLHYWNPKFFLLHVNIILYGDGLVCLKIHSRRICSHVLADLFYYNNSFFPQMDLMTKAYLYIYHIGHYLNFDFITSYYRLDMYTLGNVWKNRIEFEQTTEAQWGEYQKFIFLPRYRWAGIFGLILGNSKCSLNYYSYWDMFDWPQVFKVFFYYNHNQTYHYCTVVSVIFIHTFILMFFFKLSDETYKYFYNSQYLWYLFRSNEVNDDFYWLNDPNTIFLLDKYTRRFINTELSFKKLNDSNIINKVKYPLRKWIARKFTPMYLKSYIKKIISYREDLEDRFKVLLYDNSQYRFSKKVKSFIIRGMKRMNKKFKYFYGKLRRKEKKFVNKLYRNKLLYNYDTSLIFDYNRFLHDPKYADYHRVRHDHYDQVSLFLAHGYSRNPLLALLHLNDNDTDKWSLDITEIFEDKTLIRVHLFIQRFIEIDNVVYKRLCPRWFFIKDPSMDYITRLTKTTFGQDAYIIEPDAWFFENLFLYFVILPFYLIFISLTECYGLALEIHPNVQELWHVLFFFTQNTLYPINLQQLDLISHIRLYNIEGTAGVYNFDVWHPNTLEFLSIYDPWSVHNKIYNNWAQAPSTNPDYDYYYRGHNLGWYVGIPHSMVIPLKHFVFFLIDYLSIDIHSFSLLRIDTVRFLFHIIMILIYFKYLYKYKNKLMEFKNSLFK